MHLFMIISACKNFPPGLVDICNLNVTRNTALIASSRVNDKHKFNNDVLDASLSNNADVSCLNYYSEIKVDSRLYERNQKNDKTSTTPLQLYHTTDNS